MEGSSFKPSIGTGEGESPLGRSLSSTGEPLARPNDAQSGVTPRPITPPTPSLEVRTFSSDLGSIRNSGGAEPVPYTPSPIQAPAPSATPASPPPASMKPLGMPPPGIATGGFSRFGGTPPSITPPSPVGNSSSPLVPPSPSKSGGKKIFVAVLSFLIVIALGAVGYFFIYPLFVEENPPAAPTVPTPPVNEPELPVPEIPAPEILPSEEETPEPETPAADPWSGIQGLTTHRSLFLTRADTTTEFILSAPTLAAFRSALPSGSVATPLFSEANFKMPSGNTLPFSALATFIAPTFFTPARLTSFDEDATYFTYAAGNGTWFGIIVSLKAGVPIGPIQDSMSGLQTDPGLANFFIENPGEQGAWADGSVRGKPTSQVSFEAPGATFSYTWFDRNLLLSTNLTGAGVAAERLGF